MASNHSGLNVSYCSNSCKRKHPFFLYILVPFLILCIVFEQLFPNLNKVVFLDDDIVIQRDLSPLWEIDLKGKVNGAVETCRGEDKWVMSKRFRTYFNFSHPLIVNNLDPDECAWAYGMNIFDLAAWRKTNIRETYHYWLKEVIHESFLPPNVLNNLCTTIIWSINVIFPA